MEVLETEMTFLSGQWHPVLIAFGILNVFLIHFFIFDLLFFIFSSCTNYYGGLWVISNSSLLCSKWKTWGASFLPFEELHFLFSCIYI